MTISTEADAASVMTGQKCRRRYIGAIANMRMEESDLSMKVNAYGPAMMIVTAAAIALLPQFSWLSRLSHP